MSNDALSLRETIRSILYDFEDGLRMVIREEIRAFFGAALNGEAPAPAARQVTNGHARTGRKLDMRCRARLGNGKPCPNVSKGPRNRYMCERHLKELPVSEQKKAVAEYRERQRLSA